MSTISGLSHTACNLAKSGFGLPLPGLPADFTIDLLAKLWSSGTFTVCDHPLGNIIEFHGLNSNPNDLDLSWRECIPFLNMQKQILKRLVIANFLCLKAITRIIGNDVD